MMKGKKTVKGKSSKKMSKGSPTSSFEKMDRALDKKDGIAEGSKADMLKDIKANPKGKSASVPKTPRGKGKGGSK